MRLMTDENGENDRADRCRAVQRRRRHHPRLQAGHEPEFEITRRQLHFCDDHIAAIVQGMKFRGDELLAMDVVQGDSDRDLLVVTNEELHLSTTAISEYRLQGRNGYGIKPCNSPKAVAPQLVPRDRGGIPTRSWPS